jgi:DNA-binding NarL/FixJ family response regulator
LKKPVTIILADDHALVRRGIRKVIEEQPEFQIIAEAADGIELLEKLAAVLPDLAIIDISMPRMRGLEAAEHIRKRYPGVKILMLTMHRDRELLQRALEIGINGYMLKEDLDTDLHSALEDILAGKTFISPLIR